MPFDLLQVLHPKAKHWTICVRVSRKWEFCSGTDNGPIAYIDLVLADEQGNAIYAEIPNSEIEAKAALLEEGGIYIISRFRVSNARSLYRPVDVPYMIEFTCYIKIAPTKDPPETFPRYVYKLTPFIELPRHAGENRNFLDVIGIIAAISDPAPKQLMNQSAPTLSRDIILKDLSNVEIKLTLWGQRAVEFTIDEIYNEEQATSIVILVVGNLMKTAKNTLVVILHAAGTSTLLFQKMNHFTARERVPLYCDNYTLSPKHIMVVCIMQQMQSSLYPRWYWIQMQYMLLHRLPLQVQIVFYSK